MVYGDEKSSETIDGLLSDLETPKRFSPEQLKKFTAGFSKSLGSGAFGDVYKGVLHDGVQVAVKVLKGGILSDGVKDQFKAEVSVLGKIHHKHVVQLYGFCFEPNMKALVYEFMENGSLEKQLYGNQSIAWETLCKIAVGTAKGLAYLHEGCQRRILHYDVKPANILLDSKFSPKVGDFGLAKRLNQDTTHIIVTGFRGTPNYGAPELSMRCSSVNDKCDVFSFGISLFDIVGRRKHVEGEAEEWFPVQVWKKFKQEKQEEIIQECGIREKDKEQAKRILLIALRCTQFLPDNRPSMSHVVRLLEGTEEIPMPPNPFLYLCSSSTTQIEYPTPKSLPSVKASSSFTEEVKLPPNPIHLHMGTSSTTQIEYPTPKSLPSVKASSSFTEEVKLPPNPIHLHMGPSSAVTESVRQEDNISRTTLSPWGIGEGSLITRMTKSWDHQKKLQLENHAFNVARLKPTTVGPWGGDGGDKWDDLVAPVIQRIDIYKGIKGDVRSIEIWYCGNDGDLTWSGKHGHQDNLDYHNQHTIKLDYPSEYLVRVTGYHGFGRFYGFGFGEGASDRVRSLCFFTNKNKYGPFGKEKSKDSYFSTEKDGKNGKVIGFHGRSKTYLDAIGMHMDYS